MKALLLDCGPIVALLDQGDPRHRYTVERAGKLRGGIVTTGPVIAEAMFLLQKTSAGPDRLVCFLRELRVGVEDIFDPASLAAAAASMGKYHHIPMDFADASLVVVASRLGIGDILTLDERGFRSYRYLKNKRFNLVLQQG